jgi:4-cresol dehydrogenase (hydroxylating)
MDSVKHIFSEILGAENVIDDAKDLSYYETATFHTHQKIPLVIKPGNKDDVVKCVKAANQYGLKIYPVSGGKNWGYGTYVPPEDAIVMHMSRMNRILEFDRTSAWVRVEPGVTQEQLVDFIAKESGGELWFDTSASSPEASVIGNAMERGHGLTPYADRTTHICNFEVVLGSGDCIQTGYGAFKDGHKLKSVDRWGVGPSLDGLFTQSNFGIVTALTIYLMPAPEKMEMAIITIDEDEKFKEVIDRIRIMRLNGQLRSCPHFANVYQSLLRVMTYPWESTGGKTPLNREMACQLASEYGIGKWNGVLGIYGNKSQNKVVKNMLKEQLGPLTSRLFIFDKLTLEAGSFLPSQRIKDALKVFTQLSGGLGAVGIRRPYWRKKKAAPENVRDVDLGRDLCGYLGLTASAPFSGAECLSVVNSVEEIALKNSFEACVGILPMRDRSVQFYISICYDREVEGEDAKILVCSQQINKVLMSNGWLPHRLGVQSMDVMGLSDPQYQNILRKLKQVFDPNNVVAPGRYLP